MSGCAGSSVSLSHHPGQGVEALSHLWGVMILLIATPVRAAILLCLLPSLLCAGAGQSRTNDDLLETLTGEGLLGHLNAKVANEGEWAALGALLHPGGTFDWPSVYEQHLAPDHPQLRRMIELLEPQEGGSELLARLLSPGVISRCPELLDDIIESRYQPTYPIFTRTLRGITDRTRCARLIQWLSRNERQLEMLQDLGWLRDCLVAAAEGGEKDNGDGQELAELVLMSDFLMDPDFILRLLRSEEDGRPAVERVLAVLLRPSKIFFERLVTFVAAITLLSDRRHHEAAWTRRRVQDIERYCWSFIPILSKADSRLLQALLDPGRTGLDKLIAIKAWLELRWTIKVRRGEIRILYDLLQIAGWLQASPKYLRCVFAPYQAYFRGTSSLTVPRALYFCNRLAGVGDGLLGALGLEQAVRQKLRTAGIRFVPLDWLETAEERRVKFLHLISSHLSEAQAGFLRDLSNPWTVTHQQETILSVLQRTDYRLPLNANFPKWEGEIGRPVQSFLELATRYAQNVLMGRQLVERGNRVPLTRQFCDRWQAFVASWPALIYKRQRIPLLDKVFSKAQRRQLARPDHRAALVLSIFDMLYLESPRRSDDGGEEGSRRKRRWTRGYDESEDEDGESLGGGDDGDAGGEPDGHVPTWGDQQSLTMEEFRGALKSMAVAVGLHQLGTIGTLLDLLDHQSIGP